MRNFDYVRTKETVIKYILFSCALVSILTTLGILGVLLKETISFFQQVSILDYIADTKWTPLFYDQHFGVWPLLSGTLLVAGIALLVALPLGLLIAIFLSEYAPPKLRRFIKPILEVLAGIPTIVYGYFALLFVTPYLQEVIPTLAGFNALSPGIVMGMMILPMITSLSEDALHAVPENLREAGYGLGANKLQVSLRVVVPAATSGIVASFILGMSRAIGETMIVAIAAGQVPNLTANPLSPVETMTTYIVQVSLGDTPAGSLSYQTIFVVAMTVFVLTFSLNALSYYLRERLIKPSNE